MTHPHDALTSLPNPILDKAPGPMLGAEKLEEGHDQFPENLILETRLEAFQRETRERAAKIEADMQEADAKGELWTVQAALYPGRVFCLVYHGRNDDMEPLESQHGAAGGFFGPVHLMGDHKRVMRQALDHFVVDEITIRTVR